MELDRVILGFKVSLMQGKTPERKMPLGIKKPDWLLPTLRTVLSLIGYLHPMHMALSLIVYEQSSLDTP